MLYIYECLLDKLYIHEEKVVSFHQDDYFPFNYFGKKCQIFTPKPTFSPHPDSTIPVPKVTEYSKNNVRVPVPFCISLVLNGFLASLGNRLEPPKNINCCQYKKFINQ